jgi:hypothetical protein
MKKLTIIAAALVAAVSCQEVLIEDKLDGSISVLLDNSPVVELITKADGEETTAQPEVNKNDFNVYVTSDVASFQPLTVKYGVMETVLPVKVGNYTIYADNVAEAVSLTGWGQARYACAPITKAVESGKATTFELNCAMVNTAVSVEFIGNFSQYVADGYKVSVHVEDATSRVLEYNAANTTAETPAVGYFKPSAHLVYTFSGNNKQGNALAPVSGRLEISPKTHLTLQFKIKGDASGNINKPVLEVDTTCTVLEPVVVEVDPSKKNN